MLLAHCRNTQASLSAALTLQASSLVPNIPKASIQALSESASLKSSSASQARFQLLLSHSAAGAAHSSDLVKYQLLDLGYL